jgi:esterase/lipase superfamily enzyme
LVLVGIQIHLLIKTAEKLPKILRDNGQKLAQFIIDLNNKCKDTEIRLIAHSLAAAVVNSTLITISNNQTPDNNVDNNSNFNIKSVHLLGAPWIGM